MTYPLFAPIIVKKFSEKNLTTCKTHIQRAGSWSFQQHLCWVSLWMPYARYSLGASFSILCYSKRVHRVMKLDWLYHKRLTYLDWFHGVRYSVHSKLKCFRWFFAFFRCTSEYGSKQSNDGCWTFTWISRFETRKTTEKTSRHSSRLAFERIHRISKSILSILIQIRASITWSFVCDKTDGEDWNRWENRSW